MLRLLVIGFALFLVGCSSDAGPAPVPANGKATPDKNTPLPRGKTPAME